MKRYYISKIVGTGTEEDPIRPKVADYGVNFVMQNSDDKDWALVLVSGNKHSDLRDDVDIQPLPDASLDVKTSAINKNAVDKMKVDLKDKWAIDTGFIDGTDGFREVIRTLGKLHAANFDENNFDVSE